MLLPLYVILGGVRAIGFEECNALVSTLDGEPPAAIGVQAASGFGTIFAAERLWSTNPASAILLFVAVNGSMAATAWNGAGITR